MTPPDRPQPPEPPRCAWAGSDPQMIAYHDAEWGVPTHDDQVLFEFLILEAAQAGLSWRTVLRKREHYREVYDGFDPRVVATYGARKVKALLADPGIIRHPQKIAASIATARGLLEVQREQGSFASFAWSFVGGKPMRTAWASQAEVPSRTLESDALSKALKRRGFGFVGSTICYAFMQACGLVNDHLASCAFGSAPGRRAGR